MARIVDGIVTEYWASSGIVVNPTDNTDSNSPAFTISQGWTADYETTKYPSLGNMNYAFRNIWALALDVNRYGGALIWDETITYQPNAVVTDGNAIYISIASSINEQPSITASNWNKFSTIAELNDLYVSLIGDQTIAGVKTFNSSPIVPTATTGTQAINLNQINTIVPQRSYVDETSSRVAGNSYTNTNGYDIDVIIKVAVTAGTSNRTYINTFTVDGIEYEGVNIEVGDGDGHTTFLRTTVPTGAVYQFNNVTNSTFGDWYEYK